MGSLFLSVLFMSAGLLHPFPVPWCPWSHISLDFDCHPPNLTLLFALLWTFSPRRDNFFFCPNAPLSKRRRTSCSLMFSVCMAFYRMWSQTRAASFLLGSSSRNWLKKVVHNGNQVFKLSNWEKHPMPQLIVESEPKIRTGLFGLFNSIKQITVVLLQ